MNDLLARIKNNLKMLEDLKREKSEYFEVCHKSSYELLLEIKEELENAQSSGKTK